MSSKAAEHGIILPQLSLDGTAVGAMVRDFVAERGAALFGRTVDITASIITSVVNLFIGLVFCVYLLAQKERLTDQGRRFLYAFFSQDTADELIEVARLSSDTFAQFVTGQLTEALIIGVLCFFGTLLLSIPYATTVSVLVEVTSLIPIVGALVGTAVGAFLILMVDPIMLLSVPIVSILYVLLKRSVTSRLMRKGLQ